jgi:hypothetical protein
MADSNPHPGAESQKRRSTRIIQAVPLTVTGVDALGRPFQERTSSLIISCHGCRYQSKHYVLKNMWVTFEIPHNEAGRDPRSVRARVTWIQRPRTVRELFQIGVDLEIPGNVWGIAFPPGDWFPFPDATSSLEIPSPVGSPENESAAAEWRAEEEPAPQSTQSEENNLRVLPLPGGADTSLQISRQISRLVAEAKQQVQTTIRETATRAVAAETRPLLAALQNQMKDAAEKSVSTAVAEHIEQIRRETLQHMEREREAIVTSMRAAWTRELDRRITDARQHIDSQLAEVERARRVNFDQQIQSHLQEAIEKLRSMSGNLGANAGEVHSVIEQLRRSSAEAAEQEMRRWKELMDLRSSEARTRLAHLEQTAAALEEKIATATSAAESGWRGLLDADLAAASVRWSEKIDISLEDAARKVSERLARTSEESTREFEQQLQQRINVIGGAFSQVTQEAESSLSMLRASLSEETAKGASAISQLQQSFEQMDARRGEFPSLIQAASDELARRSEALVEAQSNEMNRRSESAVAGMVERLQPVLESAGQQTIERLANELEQRLAPQITSAAEILSKLALDQGHAEKALGEHQQKIWEASERSVQDTVSREKELLAQVEKEFGESVRVSSARWFAELETKATETTHNTFEAIFKTADWYEKKVQTQMQAALEKGVDQAATGLREKAGEMSGLFASELDHYSRTYVEHAQGQMKENARDIAEMASQQLTEAGEAASANFTDRAGQLVREQFEALSIMTEAAFDQNVARAEAHSVQVRSRLESDARALAGEFQRALSQQAQNSLAQGQQELDSQIDLAKEILRTEAQSLNLQLQTSMQSLDASALDVYKQRLENASNSWLVTTASKLSQQSEGLIDQLAESTENRLRAVCGSIFAEMGETLRTRLSAFSIPSAASASPEPRPAAAKPFEIEPEEQK